ncbi:PAS domain S-box protein [Mucilaginibacter sp. PAMB04274]|uniref:PAS domain S-box protein n=1 Tax=Mucilaginibacter sp. PAMB04274 TaxID=3138568 RepID=UPI0031F60575
MLSETEETGFSAGSFYQSDNQLRQAFMQAPGALAILRGPESLCEFNNLLFQKICGGRDLLNKPLRQAWHDPEGGEWFRMLEEVYKTGETAHKYEYAVTADWDSDGNLSERFFDFACSPYRSAGNDIDGLILFGHDVTVKVQARQQFAEQQLLFKDITDAAATALWTVDTKGDIIFVNQTWIDWTGEPYDVHLGRGWIEFVVPLDREQVINNFRRDVNLKSQYQVDFRVLRKDGCTQWVAATGKPRYLSNGEFAGYVGSCMDITERKKSEQMLRDSEERFRNIADSAPVLIWMTGVDKRTTFLNKNWTQFANVAELLSDNGHLQSSLMHPNDKEMVITSYNQAFDNREEFYLEYRMKSGEDFRWIGMKGVPRMNAGVFEGYIGSGMDITDMKEHEQVKNDFIGMASHELKTPITSIKAYIQLLLSIYKDRSEDEFLLKSLNTVNKQINKLTRLITDLLDVSKMESGRLSLNCEPFVLNDVLKETIEEVQHTATHHDIVFTPAPSYTVNADRDRIAQVMTNFLTNAIKYSPESDRIDVKVSATEHEVKIAVQDYGIGINPEEQAKIFNRFYRVEGKNEQTFSGFGIGLYVAAEIIKRHSGHVWVQSEKSNGSAFYFSLPLYRYEA